jgi:DNA-binding NarL/FixJ family response regulator
MPAERDLAGEVPRAITIVLVDDEHLIRAALTTALTAAGLEVVGDAATVSDALRLAVELRPDVVLMDLRLPDATGVEAIAQLTALAPASRSLVLARRDENRVVEALVAGASGYILKSVATDAIVAAVVATAAGESVISSEATATLLATIREREMPGVRGPDDAANRIRATLTRRELEVFERLASGATNEQIGRELNVSANTVANHIASLLLKLHLDNRIQAAGHAVRSGLA